MICREPAMSLENIRKVLEEKADSLGVSKLDVMTEAKLVIVEKVHVEVRVLSYKNNILKIATEDSPSASELRYRARELMALINKRVAPEKISRITVTVR